MDYFQNREYLPIENILAKGTQKRKHHLQNFYVNNKISDLIEKEKDLELNRKLFECNININDAYNHIMSSNLTDDSDENESKIKSGKNTAKKDSNTKDTNKRFMKNIINPVNNGNDLIDLGVIQKHKNLNNNKNFKNEPRFTIKNKDSTTFIKINRDEKSEKNKENIEENKKIYINNIRINNAGLTVNIMNDSKHLNNYMKNGINYNSTQISNFNNSSININKSQNKQQNQENGSLNFKKTSDNDFTNHILNSSQLFNKSKREKENYRFRLVKDFNNNLNKFSKKNHTVEFDSMINVEKQNTNKQNSYTKNNYTKKIIKSEKNYSSKILNEKFQTSKNESDFNSTYSKLHDEKIFKISDHQYNSNEDKINFNGKRKKEKERPDSSFSPRKNELSSDSSKSIYSNEKTRDKIISNKKINKKNLNYSSSNKKVKNFIKSNNLKENYDTQDLNIIRINDKQNKKQKKFFKYEKDHHNYIQSSDLNDNLSKKEIINRVKYSNDTLKGFKYNTEFMQLNCNNHHKPKPQTPIFKLNEIQENIKNYNFKSNIFQNENNLKFNTNILNNENSNEKKMHYTLNNFRKSIFIKEKSHELPEGKKKINSEGHSKKESNHKLPSAFIARCNKRKSTIEKMMLVDIKQSNEVLYKKNTNQPNNQKNFIKIQDEADFRNTHNGFKNINKIDNNKNQYTNKKKSFSYNCLGIGNVNGERLMESDKNIQLGINKSDAVLNNLKNEQYYKNPTDSINNYNIENQDKRKFELLREKLMTPDSSKSISSNALLQSINRIENKTNRITKSLSRNIKKYKTVDDFNLNNEKSNENRYLQIPKKPKTAKHKIVMISSSVEEKRKNLSNLSENRKNLLKIADFIESMNDKIVLELKDEILRQYKKSAIRNGLINLNEILDKKYSKILNKNSILQDITLKRKRLENCMFSTRNKIVEKYFTNQEKEDFNKQGPVKVKLQN